MENCNIYGIKILNPIKETEKNGQIVERRIQRARCLKSQWKEEVQRNSDQLS